MISKFHIPSFPLSQFIDHFFYYTDLQTEHTVDRFLPDGEVQLIFDLGVSPKYIYDNDSLKKIQSCENVWFSGFRTEPISIPSGTESELLIVQFKKGKALPFLSEPMQNITNCVVDAELVIKAEILNIREDLINAETPDKKFNVLEKKLLSFYKDKLFESPFVDFAVSKILKLPAKSTIKEIASKAGYSQKHIINLFKKHVGVTPKEFLKVIRFQTAIQQIEKHNQVVWSNIAYDCGFYDQSHFIADFKIFSGLTPTEYMQQKGENINYIPVK